MEVTTSFPHGFLWGAATAAHQVEGGNVGSDVVAKSPPDGYTVLIHTGALASAGPLYKSLSFDPIKDFAPVTNIVATQMIVAGSLKATAATLTSSFHSGCSTRRVSRSRENL